MNQQTTSLVDKCLIATPAIKDPIFASSLVYMCEHSEQGSMGLVVNHETTQMLGDLFEQLDIDCDNPLITHQPIFCFPSHPCRSSRAGGAHSHRAQHR